jgi:hypothetical protein
MLILTGVLLIATWRPVEVTSREVWDDLVTRRIRGSGWLRVLSIVWVVITMLLRLVLGTLIRTGRGPLAFARKGFSAYKRAVDAPIREKSVKGANAS